MKRLQEIFNIHPGEERMAATVLVYAIMLFASNVLAVTTSLALFFETYDAATLPYTYVLLMVVGPLISLIYLRLNNRFSLSKALQGVHIFLLLTLILLPLILSWSPAPILRFSLPVYLEMNITLTYATFWNLLGRIYNLRQGKRLFPLLSSGENIATIGAGFLTTLFVARFDTVNLYWISALFMIGAVALLIVINRANGDKMGKVAVDDAEQARPSGIKVLIKEPYVRLLFAIVTLYTLSIVMVDVLSYSQAEIRFPTADGMATFVGLFMAIFGVLGLVVQWFVAGRALDRFGVIANIFALPVGLFAFMSIFAFIGSIDGAVLALFWLAAGANLYAYTLDAPYIAARNIILQPLPAQLRTQVQTTVMGIAYPLATGLSGLLLLLLLNLLSFDSVQVSYAILVVLALWLVALARLGRAYTRRLRDALQARSLGETNLFQLPDRTSIAILEESLRGPHPAAVLYALDTLAKIAPEVLPRHLPDLLAYPDNQVRLAALERMANMTWPEAPPGVKTVLENSSDPTLRAAALKTWYALNPHLASAKLVDYGQDPHLPVRQTALAIMYLHEDPELQQQAAQALAALVESADPVERLVGAGVLGETGSAGGGDQLLVKLLQDPHPEVLHAALTAAKEMPVPSIWAVVISYLAESSTRMLAVDTLAAGGEQVLDVLQKAALKPDQDVQILSGVAQVCGRITGPEAVTVLEALLDHIDPNVQHQALLGLSRCAYRVPVEQRKTIMERFHARAALLVDIVSAQVDIGSEQEVYLTADALEQRRLMEADNLLLLLSFLDEAKTVLSARRALQLGHLDEDKRAYAVEALDILLDRDYRMLLFPFLGQKEPQQRLSEMKKQLPRTLLGREQRLRRLLAVDAPESERWTRICAIYALGLLENDEAAEGIIDAAVRFGDDPVLVETALYALAQLDFSPTALTHYAQLKEAALTWQTDSPQRMILLQKAESLKRASIFASLPIQELEAIARLTDILTAEAGESLILEGEVGTCLYVIVGGELRVYLGKRPIATVGVGDLTGEMALLDAEPRSATVTAVSEARLLRLEQEPFYQLLSVNPRVSREILKMLSRRLRERTADLAQVSSHEAVQTVLSAMGAQSSRRSRTTVQRKLMDLDKLMILKGVQFFSGLNDDLMGQVAVLLQDVDLAGGEVLFEQGEPGYSLYIVALGQVRVHIAQRTLVYLSEGEVIGEMALLEAEPRSASVTAVVPSQLLRLDQQPFFELLEVQPELAREMIKMLSSRLRMRLQELAPQQENTDS
jgi:CRP-like cAMP-binding protein/HEAT repeat protein